MGEPIYLSPPHMGDLEHRYVDEVFASNYIAPVGEHIGLFEEALCSYLDVPYAVALSSGTAALQLALRAAGVGPGDTVLVSNFTFVASVNPIRELGAEPVLIDIEEGDWNMNPPLLKQALSECQRVKAVVVTHLYGMPANIPALQSLCTEYNVPLIEDAAEALGARVGNQAAGTMGSCGILSFNGNKLITTGGGGALVTASESIARQVRHWATQARDRAIYYEHSQPGHNFRMSNVLAAIGRGQMALVESHIAARKDNYEYYASAFADIAAIQMMPLPEYGRPNYWLSCLTLNPAESKSTVAHIYTALAAETIESRPLWKPMRLQPLYRQARCYGGAASERLFRNGLCLPSGSALTHPQRERIASIVRNVVAH